MLMAKRDANFVRHLERRVIGAESHHAHDLKRANAFFARQHQVNDLEPNRQLDIGVLENRAYENREAVAIRRTVLALPVILARQLVDLFVAAARAFHAFWPAARLQIGLAGSLVRELCFQFREGHCFELVNPFHGAPL